MNPNHYHGLVGQTIPNCIFSGPIYSNLVFATNHLSIAKLASLKAASEIASLGLKKYRIKQELNKPFLQKMYELKGKGLA